MPEDGTSASPDVKIGLRVPAPGAGTHQATRALLRFFDYEHLPGSLRIVSQPFHALAHRLVSADLGLDGPELTVALRKLLEAKDCAVRAAL